MTARYFPINVNPSDEMVMQLVDSFKPYINYTATVTASTFVGYGPIATTEGRTDPDGKYRSIVFHAIL